MSEEDNNQPPVINQVQQYKIPSEVNALIVKLPVFWSNNPRTWFIQAEAQFQLGKITADVSKYNYVVASLPQEIAESISDLLEKPPTAGLYDNLKKVLIVLKVE